MILDGRELVAIDNKMTLGFIMGFTSPDVDVMNKVWEKSPKFCTVCFASKSHCPFSMMLQLARVQQGSGPIGVANIMTFQEEQKKCFKRIVYFPALDKLYSGNLDGNS